MSAPENKQITLSDIEDDFVRSFGAASVTLPIEKWVQMLNMAQFALTHGYGEKKK